MFLEAHGSLSPVQFISRCVSSVRVQANGTKWSTQKGCLPTRQPLLRVCSGLCHSGFQDGGKSDTGDRVLRTDLDPEDTDWTLPWDMPEGSPRILIQVGTGPLDAGGSCEGLKPRTCVLGPGRPKWHRLRWTRGGDALSGTQSGNLEEAPCAGLTGSGLQALRRAGHPGGALRSEVGGQLVAGLPI